MLYEKFISNFSNLIGEIDFKAIAIAVSGGADSVALLNLMTKWSAANKVKLVVMNVNHNLRAEAKLEGDYVAALSKQLGLECFMLAWNPQNNFANLQARARAGRYQLMTAHCHQLNILTLITAHHREDYIENFLIRKQRKSSPLGLSSSNINFYNNIRILRPLFDLPKQDLVDYLIKNKIQWFEDQSNYSDKYQRSRIRKEISRQQADFKEAITKEQLAVNLAASQLSSQLVAIIAEAVTINPFGLAIIELTVFSKVVILVKLQLLSFILTIISGNTSLPRAESVSFILSCLEQKQDFIKTLHDCIMKRVGCKLLIYRSFGKKSPLPVKLDKGIIWDNRFRFDGEIEGKPQSYITNLQMSEYIAIKKELKVEELKKSTLNNHRSILFTLPVIKEQEIVLAIPHIGYYSDISLLGKLHFSYQPPFTSRFTHFY